VNDGGDWQMIPEAYLARTELIANHLHRYCPMGGRSRLAPYMMNAALECCFHSQGITVRIDVKDGKLVVEKSELSSSRQ